jgi:hypothetical protein
MMTVDDAKDAFTGKLGAAQDKSGKHIFFYFKDGDLDYTVGKISHSWRGQLNDTQILMLAKKLYLQKQEFEKWVDCTLKNHQMLQIWRARRPRYTS